MEIDADSPKGMLRPANRPVFLFTPKSRNTVVNSEALTAMTALSVVTEVVPDGDQKGSNFFLYVFELAERGVLRLCADRRVLAPHSSAGFLLELGRVLVAAVLTDSGAFGLGVGAV